MLAMTAGGATSVQDIGGRAVWALKWSMFIRLSGQLIVWVMTFWTIRLLEPQDYGLNAIAMAFCGMFLLVSEGGLNMAVVQAKEISHEELRKIYGFIVLVSTVLTGLVASSGELLAGFFDMEELTHLVPLLSLQILIFGLGSMHQALLIREIRLKEKSRNEFWAAIAGGLTTLSMAYLGYGYWSLATGVLAMLLLRSVLNMLTVRVLVLPSLNMRGILGHLHFGAYVTGQRIVWHCYMQADTFIIGRLLDSATLGIYAVGKQIASLPVDKTGAILSEVVLSSFSRLQSEPDRAADYMLRGLRSLMTIVVPAFVGIALVANDAVPLILGEKWIGAVIVIQFLAIAAPFRIVNMVLLGVANAKGRPEVPLGGTVFSAMLVPSAIFIGAHWGLFGVCVAWIATMPVTTLFNLVRCLPLTTVTFRRLTSALAGPVVASAAMFLVCWQIIGILPAEFSSVGRVLAIMTVGVLSYVAVSVVVNYAGISEVYRFTVGKRFYRQNTA